ncbi:MAG: TetR/AcrR family transcriptional regulator [Proteobacteria bacterium]|nr:TetR/AcrR family transcriptional regulator [Pseudomonadota bacterium]
MARRSDHSREELADLIVQAARKLVARGGRRAVTARAIAGEIGYAPGSIYNAVGDIDLVLLRVSVEVIHALADRLDAVAQESQSMTQPLQRVLAVAEAYMRFVTANHLLWAGVMEPGLSRKQAPDWYSAARLRLIQRTNDVLVPFFDDADDRSRAAVALWAGLEGVAALEVSGNLALEDGIDAVDLARSIVSRYLTGSETPAQPGRRPRRRPRRRA